MAKARLQRFADGGGCLRVWDDPNARTDEDVEQFACCVEIHKERNRATLHGVTEPIEPARWEAIKQNLQMNGFRFVEYTARNLDESRQIVSRLN